MIQVVCDRCGKVIDEPDVTNRFRLEKKKSFTLQFRKTIQAFDMCNIQLCSTCKDGFFDWMKMGRDSASLP